jgi:uncharacterized protein YeeX (DUF496 family)
MTASQILGIIGSIFGVLGVGGMAGIFRGYKKSVEESVRLKITVEALHSRLDKVEIQGGVCTMHPDHEDKIKDHEKRIRELESERKDIAERFGTIEGKLDQIIRLLDRDRG